MTKATQAQYLGLNKCFFAPPALIVLHNAAVIRLRYQVVLFVTLALTSDLESDNCTHKGALALTRVGGSVLSILFDVCRSDWEKRGVRKLLINERFSS
jgi:hypothetical protein